MRIIFAGTPDFAAAHLQAILETQSHAVEIVAVYTQPDRKAGRGKKLLPSPVKMLALDHGIPVHQPLSLKTPEEQQRLAAYDADLMVVAAYGMLLPEAILNTPKLGCINVHASLLPRWRGAAPVERAIMAGDQETGVTIMQMDAGLDTGDMLLTASCTIDATETGDSLRNKLICVGKPLLLEAMDKLENHSLTAIKQNDSEATYAKKLHKLEMQINWLLPAMDIERKIRAFTSALNCFAQLGESRVRIASAKIAPAGYDTLGAPGHITLLESCPELGLNEACLQTNCGDGSLIIDIVQIPGGKAMSIRSLLNGKPTLFQTGMHFELPAESESTPL